MAVTETMLPTAKLAPALGLVRLTVGGRLPVPVGSFQPTGLNSQMLPLTKSCRPRKAFRLGMNFHLPRMPRLSASIVGAALLVLLTLSSFQPVEVTGVGGVRRQTSGPPYQIRYWSVVGS